MAMQYRKTRMVLNFKKDKPVVYKLSQLGLLPVTTEQLVNECSISCGVNPSQTRAVVSALLDRMVHYMSLGHAVKLGSGESAFGSFKPTFRSKTTRNLEDADVTTVTAKVIRFYPGKAFRDMMNDMGIVSASEKLSVEE